jgi:hypothetical protein
MAKFIDEIACNREMLDHHYVYSVTHHLLMEKMVKHRIDYPFFIPVDTNDIALFDSNLLVNIFNTEHSLLNKGTDFQCQ